MDLIVVEPDQKQTTETPYDVHGHGTQTMGVMVGGNASGKHD